MKTGMLKKYLLATGLFLVITVMGLWAWNTLAELFNGPQAQYRHALAAFTLLLMLRWAIGGGQIRRTGTGHGHGECRWTPPL